MWRTTLDWKVVSKRLKRWISFQVLSRANILPNKHTLIQIEAFQYDSFPSFNNTPPAVAFKPLAASNSIKRHRTPSATFIENGNELLAKVGRGLPTPGQNPLSHEKHGGLFNKKEIYSLRYCSPSFPLPSAADYIWKQFRNRNQQGGWRSELRRPIWRRLWKVAARDWQHGRCGGKQSTVAWWDRPSGSIVHSGLLCNVAT